VAPLMAAPPASNSGHATSLSSDAVPASSIGTRSQGGEVAYWLMRCATCRLNNEVGIPLGTEVHEFAVRCHACVALNKVSLDAGGETLLVAEGLTAWAHPSEPLPAVQEQDHEEPPPTPRPIPVVEKLKREREAAEARDARAAKRNTGARGDAERR
jgi:hypothetical protein